MDPLMMQRLAHQRQQEILQEAARDRLYASLPRTPRENPLKSVGRLLQAALAGRKARRPQAASTRKLLQAGD